MRVTECGIHGFGETLGLDVEEFRVWWRLDSPNADARQTAYRVVISTDSSVSEQDHIICFDSGRCEGDVQRNVLCQPRNGFAATTMHYWTVTIWDEKGEANASSVQDFYTAYPRGSHLLPPYSMNQTYMPHTSLIFRAWFEDEADRWKAVWIGDGSDKPLYLRKSFRIDRKPVRVMVLASGLGHFNLTVNGQPTSAHVLDPGWTDYHKTVQFVGYDVTDKILEGENVIGSHLGNGFYAGDQGDRFFWPKYEDNTYVRHGNELCFFAEIHVHYDNGDRECIISDPSWNVRKSATSLANIYASEDHDRRAYPQHWDEPGFDTAGWSPAKPLTGPRGKLRYQSQPPVVLHNALSPVSQKIIKDGVVVCDLGQNSSIMVKITASGMAGQRYLVKYSETLGEDGLITMPDPLFKEFETGVYSAITLSGAGLETWSPDFSFTSARYIQIEGASFKSSDEMPIIHSVTAHHISSAAGRLGFVRTDKDDVNELINACYWTFSSNLFSYHTDCPQIEKFGWLEVTTLLFPATQYVRDMEALYSKIIDDIIDAQERSGLVPTMAPLYRYMYVDELTSCGPMHDTISWGGAVCLLPELIKRYYGSTAVFSKVFKSCVDYLEYIRIKERDGGLIEHGLGDWGRDIAFGNHQANIETAVYYKCLRNVAMMADELGLRPEVERFGKWADRIRDIYNQRLLVTDRTTWPYAFYTSRDELGIRDRTMVAQAVALQFDLVPKEYRADIITAFIADADDSGHVMRAGEIGLKYLWNTLAEPDVNRPDIVLDMARQEEHPSYMRFMRRGETTLLEFWQDACRSKCHDMLGTIYEWFYSYVLGVQPTSDAYKTWSLTPCFQAEFDFIESEIRSPYGLIAVCFDRRSRDDGGALIRVTVPTGTLCQIALPGQESRARVSREGSSETEHQGQAVQLRQGTYNIEIER